MPSTATGRIKITKVPGGEAPLWIRRSWVGLILPCSPYVGYFYKGSERGVLTRKEDPRNGQGFSVPQKEALEILEKHEPKAAKWWKTNGYPKPRQYFGFAEEEAEIVSGVTQQQIVEVTGEMQGDPNR